MASPAKKQPEKAAVSVEHAKSNRSTVPKKGWKDSDKGVDSIEGYNELGAEDKQIILDKIAGKSKVAGDSGAAAPKKRPPPEDGDSKSKKKKKKGEEEPEVDVEAIQKKYDKMTSTSLKTVLKNNLQGGYSTMRKEQLVAKCVDGEINGALPICPMCKKACVQISSDKDGYEIFTCPGYFDAERMYRVACKFREERVERIKPWLQLDDQPRADPNAPKKAEVVKAEPGGFAGLSSKDAMNKLVEMARENGLSLPKNNPQPVNIAAGTALNATKNEDGSWNPEAAMKQLAEKFPKASEEKDKAASKVPANDALCEALDELAKFEMKQNMFKGQSIRKGVDALRGLDFEVTSGKALAAGKQKVAGIGKGIGERIDEFLTSGTIAILEGYRAEYS